MLKQFKRPISEPPIFDYSELIGWVEDVLETWKGIPKFIRCGHDIRIGMKSLQVMTEDYLIRMYIDWAEDMLAAAVEVGSDEERHFYHGLFVELMSDFFEDFHH